MTTEASVPRRKLSAIVMVDVSGFSRMMGQNEERTTVLIREFHDRTQGLVESHQGRVVDSAGDSVFGEFDSVVNAMRCAQAIQETQAVANAGRVPAERIETRIGVHLGDVIVQDYRVYGDGVNIAARLQTIAAPGSICVSEAVYQQVYKKLDLLFEDLGVQPLKNIEQPIRLYRVSASQTPRATPHLPGSVTWTDAVLHPWSLALLIGGAYLLATALGLPPAGRLLPAYGVVLLSLGVGRVLKLRTGRPAYFFIALGPGLVLGAVAGNWRHGTPWWLVVGGIVVTVIGLSRLRGGDPGRARL